MITVAISFFFLIYRGIQCFNCLLFTPLFMEGLLLQDLGTHWTYDIWQYYGCDGKLHLLISRGHCHLTDLERTAWYNTQVHAGFAPRSRVNVHGLLETGFVVLRGLRWPVGRCNQLIWIVVCGERSPLLCSIKELKWSAWWRELFVYKILSLWQVVSSCEVSACD